MAASELVQFKQGARAAWGAGDYELVAKRTVWQLGGQIVGRLGVAVGEHVLDVGCGTGNGAIRAAAAGGLTVGLDLAPELFDSARRLAAEAGVDVEWIEGDAEALPFEDETFDVVFSLFGCMFAPRHELAARELARVLRRGGRLGVCSWTPEGSVGRFYEAVGRHLPPLPDFASPPPLWGSEDHVRRLFAATGVELKFQRGEVAFPPFESADEEVEFYSTKLGPVLKLRQLTEAEGRWDALRDDLVADAALHQPQEIAEYLLVLGAKR
jgi:SAM-dependent methyltransferase